MYSLLFIGMGIAANIGNIAIQFIQPNLGWWGVFIFFGSLTAVSTTLLLFFNERPEMPLNFKFHVEARYTEKKQKAKLAKKQAKEAARKIQAQK